MPRYSWLVMLAAVATSHAEDLQSCADASTPAESEDVSLLQKVPGGRVITRSLQGRKQPSFAEFIQKHDRKYTEGSAEYEHRRSLYERRAREALAHNERPVRLWKAGMNHLSDWSDAELSRLRGWKGSVSRQSGTPGAAASSYGSGMSLLQTPHASVLKDKVSWMHLNASKFVHDQGGCGSCWAFASSLMLETNYEIHQKHGRTFSQQELVDCVRNTHHCGGAGGCNGATVELAMDYAIKHGLEDKSTTPYVGTDLRCSKDLSLVGRDDTNSDDLESIITPGVHSAVESSKGPSAFGLVGWERLPENKYEPLMRAVMERGPVAVSVAASGWSFYIEGIFDSCDADAVIDHAVTLIGYGRDDKLKEKFWLIQNSWGAGWGEEGRVRILRRDNDETQCGTDSQPKAGTACDDGPKEVTVCGMCGILYDSVVPHFSAA